MAEFAAHADPIVAVGPTVRPPAPEGFHYRGDAPTFLGSGAVSKLCSFIDNEAALTKKQKYAHMYVRIQDKDGMEVVAPGKKFGFLVFVEQW